MPRIFFGNFDFEHELAGSVAGISSSERHKTAQLRQSMGGPKGSELFWVWLPVVRSHDFIIAPGRIDQCDFAALTELGFVPPHFVHEARDLDAPPGVELVPWGWTDSVYSLGRSLGWKCPSPPLDVVRLVNSRAFRLALEREWEIGLPGAVSVTSIAELEAIIKLHANAPRGWLLKANFGMSGREALRGRGTMLDQKTRNWVQKRIASSGPIVVEPILERVTEAGIQIEIPQSGSPELVGITPLLVDRSGVYRGSRFGSPASELAAWQPAVDVGQRVAQTIQRLGYFGPLGLDAMEFRDATGTIRLRALQDLNARYTMGRLALGFRRILPPGWCGSWLHFTRRHLAGHELDSWLDDVRHSLPGTVLTAITSPRLIGSQPVEHHAVVILAATSESRRQTESAIFGSLGIETGIG